MTADLELTDVVGVRQTLTVVLPVRLRRTPDWPEGPFPFELGGRRTDTPTRATYFAPASARALYGAPGRPCRWHRPISVTHEGVQLEGMELLCTATVSDAAGEPQHALAVLHFVVHRPLLPVLRAIGRRFDAGPDPLSGPLAPDTLLRDVSEVREPTPGSSFTSARPYTIAFLSPGTAADGHGPALRPAPEAALPAGADRWLWQLASRTTSADFPLAPEIAEVELSGAVRISADWSALVLRSGTAFLGHRADTGQDSDFYAFAALHTRSVYVDALLLGSLQRDKIDELTDELSAVFAGHRLARRVADLEQSIALFRSTYWRQHLTVHGPANELLLAFQSQYRLPDRFAEIVAEAADYSRLVQTQESQQISAALGVLTILGLPLGTAFGVLQTLGDDSPTHLLIALGLAVAATAAALTTRYGRLVLSALRGSGHRRRRR